MPRLPQRPYSSLPIWSMPSLLMSFPCSGISQRHRLMKSYRWHSGILHDRSKNHVERLSYQEILYILKDGKYTVFHQQGGRVNSVRKTLSQVFGEFGRAYFCFDDRGHILNPANVTGMDEDRILPPGRKDTVISRSNVTAFKAALLRFWGNRHEGGTDISGMDCLCSGGYCFWDNTA